MSYGATSNRSHIIGIALKLTQLESSLQNQHRPQL